MKSEQGPQKVSDLNRIVLLAEQEAMFDGQNENIVLIVKLQFCCKVGKLNCALCDRRLIY